MPIPDTIARLVKHFQENVGAYQSGAYNETQTRREFIDPFFEALGWDVSNKQQSSELYKEVIHEDSIKVAGSTKAPDYCFRVGGARKFFVEAKKPSVRLLDDVSAAFQVRRYGWSAKLPVSVLTDFEEFAIYDCRVVPVKTDKASTARLNYIEYTEYADRWDEIYSLFSKEAVLSGSLDQFIETQQRKGIATVDTAFLKEIEIWREWLAVDLSLQNEGINQRQLNYAVQMIINRIIFLRICEDRGIEPYEQLHSFIQHPNIYEQLCRLFQNADARYNSGLFHFKAERDREDPDEFTLDLSISDNPLKRIIQDLYYPDSPYEFSVIPIEILGQVYEQFLGKVILLKPNHQAIVEEKPEVRKAGGVYYTPTYIVDYIVENTIGKLLEGKTPKQAEKLKVLDPACGSGSFLIGAYQYLLNWHLRQYTLNPDNRVYKKRIYQASNTEWRLTSNEKKRILLNNIYGVDIDLQAVETTKLSLLLKVLEGESQETVFRQLQLLQERALPDLEENIKCGNSLVASDFYDDTQISLINEDVGYRVNVFDWQEVFPQIFRVGGFDVVIGNPPYIDSEWMTKYKSEERQYCTSHYQSASGNWDIFCVFIEKAVGLCKPNGLTSFIVPNKLGSTDYATEARRVLAVDNNLLLVRDYSRVPVFPVSVYPIVYIAQKQNKSSRKQSVLYERMTKEIGLILRSEIKELDYKSYFSNPALGWAIFSEAQNHSLTERIRQNFPRLDEFAVVLGAATVSEAYEIKSLIREADIQEEWDVNSIKVVNSGTIDRYVFLWGRKSCRYLKQKYDKPVILKEQQLLLPKKRLQQAKTPKIVVSGMTLVLESAIDLDGSYLAGKSTFIIFSELNLLYILGILNSKLMSFYYRNAFGGNTLQGGYLRIGRSQLATLPFKIIDTSKVEEGELYNQMVERVKQMLSLQEELVAAQTSPERKMKEQQIKAVDRQINRLVYTLYGLTEDEITTIETNQGVANP